MKKKWNLICYVVILVVFVLSVSLIVLNWPSIEFEAFDFQKIPKEQSDNSTRRSQGQSWR